MINYLTIMGEKMKNIITSLTSLFFTLSSFTLINAKDDDEIINRLSSMYATGADYSWDRVPQSTKYAENVKKKYNFKN